MFFNVPCIASYTKVDFRTVSFDAKVKLINFKHKKNKQNFESVLILIKVGY